MDIDETLALCIERLAKGESVESCLERYPDEAAQLEPLLRMAAMMRSESKPVLSDAGFRRGRQAVADAASTHKAFALVHGPTNSTITLVEESAKRSESRRRARRRPVFAWPALAGTAIAACLMIIVLMVGSQSDSVLPGSALYDVKLLSEQGQGLLMAAAGDDAQWQAQLADRRLSELQTLESTGQSVTAGQVERLADQVDAALLAGASLPEDDQAQLYASLQRDLDEATRTLDTGGDALTALYRVQAALAASRGGEQVAVVSPSETRVAQSTQAPESDAVAALSASPTPLSTAAPESVETEPEAQTPQTAEAAPGDSESEEPEATAAPEVVEPEATESMPAEPTPPSEAQDAIASQPEQPAPPAEVAEHDQGEQPVPPELAQAAAAAAADDGDALAAAPQTQAEQPEASEEAEPPAPAEPATPVEPTSEPAAPVAPAAEPVAEATDSPAEATPSRPFQPTPTWTPLPQPTQGPALVAQPAPESESPPQPKRNRVWQQSLNRLRKPSWPRWSPNRRAPKNRSL